jgi:hypothetical protein
MDDAFLDGHLKQTIAYWYGLRQPCGVPVELSRRCLYVEPQTSRRSYANTAILVLASIVRAASGERRKRRKRWRSTNQDIECLHM